MGSREADRCAQRSWPTAPNFLQRVNRHAAMGVRRDVTCAGGLPGKERRGTAIGSLFERPGETPGAIRSCGRPSPRGYQRRNWSPDCAHSFLARAAHRSRLHQNFSTLRHSERSEESHNGVRSLARRARDDEWLSDSGGGRWACQPSWPYLGRCPRATSSGPHTGSKETSRFHARNALRRRRSVPLA